MSRKISHGGGTASGNDGSVSTEPDNQGILSKVIAFFSNSSPAAVATDISYAAQRVIAVLSGDSTRVSVDTSNHGAVAECHVVAAEPLDPTSIGSVEVVSSGRMSIARGFIEYVPGTYSNQKNGVTKLEASGDGAIARGSLRITDEEYWGYSEIIASGEGAFAGGAAQYFAWAPGGVAGNKASIQASGGGAFAHGYVFTTHETNNAGGLGIRATDFGSVAMGYASGAGQVVASRDGAIALGVGRGGQLNSGALGSLVHGYAYGGGQINASTLGLGAVAGGYANGAGRLIEATNHAAQAYGRAIGAFGILASGYASVAVGHADTADIVASANNSVQYGPGTNAEANTVSIGTGMRLKGTTGAPAAPRNGDVWVDVAGDVYIRSGGVSVLVA